MAKCKALTGSAVKGLSPPTFILETQRPITYLLTLLTILIENDLNFSPCAQLFPDRPRHGHAVQMCTITFLYDCGQRQIMNRIVDMCQLA